LVLHLPTYQEKPLAFSINAAGGQIDGLTDNDSLLYPLNGISIPAGSSRGISNRITQSPVVLRLSAGVALITVTPDH
jgi:thiamine pyrophosphokinase